MKPFRSLVVVAVSTVLTSCCTMGLWGFEWQDGESGDEDDGSYVQAEGTRWEWWRILLRVALTPVTLCADAGLSALAGSLDTLLCDSDDDETKDRYRGSCGPASTRAASAAGGTPIKNGVFRAAR